MRSRAFEAAFVVVVVATLDNDIAAATFSMLQ